MPRNDALRYQLAKKPKPDNPYKYIEAVRVCLSCGKGFLSEWIGNRICSTCGTTSKFTNGL